MIKSATQAADPAVKSWTPSPGVVIVIGVLLAIGTTLAEVVVVVVIIMKQLAVTKFFGKSCYGNRIKCRY